MGVLLAMWCWHPPDVQSIWAQSLSMCLRFFGGFCKKIYIYCVDTTINKNVFIIILKLIFIYLSSLLSVTIFGQLLDVEYVWNKLQGKSGPISDQKK